MIEFFLLLVDWETSGKKAGQPNQWWEGIKRNDEEFLTLEQGALRVALQ